MLTIDDAAALTALQNVFAPGSVDSEIVGQKVDDPASLASPIVQDQLENCIVQAESMGADFKVTALARAVLAYWRAQ